MVFFKEVKKHGNVTGIHASKIGMCSCWEC